MRLLPLAAVLLFGCTPRSHATVQLKGEYASAAGTATPIDVTVTLTYEYEPDRPLAPTNLWGAKNGPLGFTYALDFKGNTGLRPDMEYPGIPIGLVIGGGPGVQPGQSDYFGTLDVKTTALSEKHYAGKFLRGHVATSKVAIDITGGDWETFYTY